MTGIRAATALLAAVMVNELLCARASAAEIAGFDEFAARCEADGHALWGVSLCAPVVLVDPASGHYRASRPAPGPLPKTRANRAIEWAGEEWVMVLEPLPDDEAERLALLFHEAWHVHQEELGFKAGVTVAGHLDDERKRYLLRLEWEALAAALEAEGQTRADHVAQALAFRAERLDGDEHARDSERELMRHEGLAAYTGAALSGDARRLAVAALADGHRADSPGRSFAYASGPAWGLLLDDLRPGWRAEIRHGGDLPELMPVEAAPRPDPDAYGSGRILAEVAEVSRAKAEEIERAVALTSPENALRLPLESMSMDFDPDRVSTAPDGSTLYRRITLRDRWGSIVVEDAPLRVAPDFSAAFVPWPLSESVVFERNEDWTIVETPDGGRGLTRVP